MKKFTSKIFPIFRNKDNKKCCICLEISNDCVSCTNPKCSDGIVCLKCLKQMEDSQKNHCQICRVEMDAFKTIEVKPVEIISNIREHSVITNSIHKLKCFRSGETRPTCCKTIREGICLLLITALVLLITYCSGLICVFMFTGVMDTNFNPIIHILIGFVFMVLSFALIWSCGILKIYLINKYCLNNY